MESVDILNALIKKNNFKSYLEIGVGNPESNFNHIICDKKEGVDPYDGSEPFEKEWIESIKYHMTSDQFFFKNSKIKYDLIFIDGMHEEVQCDNDIYNSIRHINNGGIIVIHDCLPWEEKIQIVPRESQSWTGNVWKSVAKLVALKKKGLVKFDIETVDTNTGIAIISNIKNKQYNLPQKDTSLTWDEYNQRRDVIMNIISEYDFYTKYIEGWDIPKGIVISSVQGRIGNELFAITTGKYTAEKYNRRFYVDIADNKEYFKENPFKKYLFHNTEFINNYNEIDFGKFNTYVQHNEYHNILNYQPIIINENVSVITGWRQTPKYWDNNHAWCRDIYKMDNDIYNTIVSLYHSENLESCISVQVRRGDYQDEDVKKSIGLLSTEYYKNAMNRFGKEECFLILSDDIEWCKEQFKDYNCVYADKTSDKINKILLDLYIPSFCKANIISNSTFAWWAAYLNPKPGRMVIYPQPWFRNLVNDDIIPYNDRWEPEKAIFEE